MIGRGVVIEGEIVKLLRWFCLSAIHPIVFLDASLRRTNCLGSICGKKIDFLIKFGKSRPQMIRNMPEGANSSKVTFDQGC